MERIDEQLRALRETIGELTMEVQRLERQTPHNNIALLPALRTRLDTFKAIMQTVSLTQSASSQNQTEKAKAIHEVAAKAFEAESKRAETLTAKAEKTIAAIAVVGALQTIDLQRLYPWSSWERMFPMWLAVGGLGALGFGLFTALQSMRVQDYSSLSRGTALLDTLNADTITASIANVSIARLYLVARETNARLNDTRAGLMRWSGRCLLIGFLLALISRITDTVLGGIF